MTDTSALLPLVQNFFEYDLEGAVPVVDSENRILGIIADLPGYCKT